MYSGDAYNPCTQEAGLNEFKASQYFIAGPCIQKQKKRGHNWQAPTFQN